MQREQRRPKAPRHLDRPLPALADFIEREPHERIPVGARKDEAEASGRIEALLGRKPSVRERGEEIMDLIDRLHGGRRIVDRGREGALCDVGEAKTPTLPMTSANATNTENARTRSPPAADASCTCGRTAIA